MVDAALAVGLALKVPAAAPVSRLRTVIEGFTPVSGVSPCWSTLRSTGQSCPAFSPLGGSELSPTVAQPPRHGNRGSDRGEAEREEEHELLHWNLRFLSSIQGARSAGATMTGLNVCSAAQFGTKPS